MPLINLTTNLKGLGFGNDKPNGGSSNEPYIKTQIPATNEPLQTGFSLSSGGLEALGIIAAAAGAGAAVGAIGGSVIGATGAGAVVGAVAGIGIGIAGAALTSTPGNPASFKVPSAGTGGPDFLLRGGTLLPNRIIRDVERIGNLIIDTKSVKGILFTIKQNLLSRVAVKTEGTRGVLLNDGVYSPTSTLASVAGVALGGYFNKQGINPFVGLGQPYTPRRYYDNVNIQNLDFISGIGDSILTNRLYGLYTIKIVDPSYPDINASGYANDISANPNFLLSYRGGPGSTLGISKTNIKIVDNLQRTSFEQQRDRFLNDPTQLNEYDRITDNQKFKFLGEIYRKKLKQAKNFSAYTPFRGSFPNGPIVSFDPFIRSIFRTGDPKTKTEDNSFSAPSEFSSRGWVSVTYDQTKTTVTTPKYYGQQTDRSLDNQKIIESDNFLSPDQSPNTQNNDIIDFIISIISPSSEQQIFNYYFPAYIEAFDDGYTVDWKAEKFMGRGEDFYTYNGFSRDMSLTFKTYARNPVAMDSMYNNLRKIIAALTPAYSSQGFMQGNFFRLTVGNYLQNTPAIITSFKINEVISPEINWEINTEYALPYIFTISMQFKPLYDFLPSSIFSTFINDNTKRKLDTVATAMMEDELTSVTFSEPKYESDFMVFNIPTIDINTTPELGTGIPKTNPLAGTLLNSSRKMKTLTNSINTPLVNPNGFNPSNVGLDTTGVSPFLNPSSEDIEKILEKAPSTLTGIEDLPDLPAGAS